MNPLTGRAADGGRVTATASPRLAVYSTVGAAAMLLGLVAGRPGYAVFGAPLLVLAVVPVVLSRPPTLTLHANWSPERVVAGDELTLQIEGRAQPSPGRLELIVER